MLRLGDRFVLSSPQRRRGRGWRRLRAAILAALAVTGGIVACSGSSSDTLPPTTGILIRAETLTAGKGCGPGPTQLFKYVVVVYGYGGSASTDPLAPESYQVPVTSNIFDCYTDGAFISLPSADGNSTFRLEVFAYNKAAYESGRGQLDTAKAVGRIPRDGALSSYAKQLREQTVPTWTTQCRATQLNNVQALASCAPLAPGMGGLGGAAGPTVITLDTAKFTLPNGRIATCATASPAGDGDGDGGVDGGDSGADAGEDAEAGVGEAGVEDAAASDASLTDGGAPLSFTKVRVRTRFGATILADTVVACPATYALEVVPEPARFDIDVGLLDADGNLVDPEAQIVCSATSTVGGTSSAICR